MVETKILESKNLETNSWTVEVELDTLLNIDREIDTLLQENSKENELILSQLKEYRDKYINSLTKEEEWLKWIADCDSNWFLNAYKQGAFNLDYELVESNCKREVKVNISSSILEDETPIGKIYLEDIIDTITSAITDWDADYSMIYSRT